MPRTFTLWLAHGEVVAARVGVARANGGDDLRERDVVLQQLARIDFGDVLARAAAERSDVDDAGDLLDLAGDEPILRGLDFV